MSSCFETGDYRSWKDVVALFVDDVARFVIADVAEIIIVVRKVGLTLLLLLFLWQQLLRVVDIQEVESVVARTLVEFCCRC